MYLDFVLCSPAECIQGAVTQVVRPVQSDGISGIYEFDEQAGDVQVALKSKYVWPFSPATVQAALSRNGDRLEAR